MKRSGVLIGILLMLHASPAGSASPYEQLDDFFRKATTILTEASRGEVSRARATQAQHDISRLARPLFDVRGAARRVLEPEWRTLSVIQREEFIRLFGDHLLWGYLSLVRGKLARDRPPAIRLVAEEIGAGGRVALVRTVIRDKEGADVRFDYVMAKAGPNWLVQDVVVDGISLIENYRAQVAQVLRGSSYAGLVARLRGGPQPENRPVAGEPVPYPPARRAAPLNAEQP